MKRPADPARGTRPPRTGPRAAALGLLAAALAALLLTVVWPRKATSPGWDPGSTRGRGSPSTPGGGPAAAHSDPTAEGRPAGSLTIRVVSGLDGRPLAGARVALARAGQGEARPPLPPLAGLQAEVTADGAGQAAVPVPDDLHRWHVWASASGHASASTTASDTREVLLRLPPGAEIRGRLLTPEGAPAPALELRASAESHAASAVSDADGRLLLSPLAPGLHRLQLVSPGWRLTGSRGASAAQDGSLWARADGSVELTVVPLARVRFRLLDAETREPVRPTLWSARVRPAGHEAVTWIALPRALPEPAPTSPAGGAEPAGADALSASVDLDAAGPWPAEALLEVEALGYRPCSAQVRLHAAVPPGSAGAAAPERDAPLAADEVLLEPDLRGARGALVVECPREGAAGLLRPETRVLSACRSSDGVLVSVQGTALGGEVWRFRGVPAGRVVAYVHDGLGASDPLELEVGPGEERAVRARFPAPTGLTLQLRGPEGNPLHGADVVLLLPPGRQRGVPNVAAITKRHGSAEAPLLPLLPLEPGAWTCLVVKRGFAGARMPVLVSAGRVTALEARLAPEPEER